LLLTVSISVGLNQALHGRSFFLWQLEMRGHNIQDGPHSFLLRTTRVSSFMTELQEDENPSFDPESQTPRLRPETPLELALRTFDETGLTKLPVVTGHDTIEQIGWATQVNALRAYTKVLVDTSVEEHR